ncbi:hypothetical protein P7C70_g7749, partial [Phenoliferia sp. Uapishka_3]
MSPSDSFLHDVDLCKNEDAPTQFFGPTSPWTFSLAPSSYGKSPSLATETNIFDFSFDEDSLKPHSLEDWDGNRTPGADLAASASRRKRAFSSPAVTPGGSGFNLTFGGMNSFKRPRLSLDADAVSTASSATSGSSGVQHQNGASSAENEMSPVSSSVFTPPDSGVPPPHYPYDKSDMPSYADPSFFQDEGFYQSVLAATSTSFSPMPIVDPVSLSATPPTSIAGLPSYEQFVFAPVPSPAIDGSAIHSSVTNVTPFIYHLEAERNSLISSGPSYVQTEPGPLSLPPRLNAPGSPPEYEARGPGRKGKKIVVAPVKGKKGAKKSKKALKEEEDVAREEEGGAEDEEARRKMFLERNRVAACKSRQKKKERVGNLEAQASGIAARNHALQANALALRNEVIQLRGLLSLHDGCTCSHVGGYLARESSGGGIPTIDSLSKGTLDIDYTNVPKMASVDDCYSEIFNKSREASVGPSESSASASGQSSEVVATATATVLEPVAEADDVGATKTFEEVVKSAIPPTLALNADFDMSSMIDIPVGLETPPAPLASCA